MRQKSSFLQNPVELQGLQSFPGKDARTQTPWSWAHEYVRWTVENPRARNHRDIRTNGGIPKTSIQAHSGRSRAFEEDVTGQRTDADSMPIQMLWSKASVTDVAR